MLHFCCFWLVSYSLFGPARPGIMICSWGHAYPTANFLPADSGLLMVIARHVCSRLLCLKLDEQVAVILEAYQNDGMRITVIHEHQ